MHEARLPHVASIYILYIHAVALPFASFCCFHIRDFSAAGKHLLPVITHTIHAFATTRSCCMLLLRQCVAIYMIR